MTTKKFPLAGFWEKPGSVRFFFLLLSLYSAGFLCAQHAAEGALVGSDRGENSFRVVETPEGVQIIQRLSWLRDENDFRYEVIIEKQDENGGYTQILRQGRTENFIELSLSIGRYRYRVLVYNLLDRFEYSTSWAGFSIDLARPPVLDRIRPGRFTLTGKDRTWVIDMEGGNLLPESEVTLRPIAGGDAVLPGEYTASPDGKSGRVVFRSGDLAAGRYELYVKNPGGFETRRECTVRDRLLPDLSVSVSYAPLVPMYGYLSELFHDGMYLPGLSLQAGFLPFRGEWGSLGAGVFVFWNYLAVAKTDRHASVQLFDFQLNLWYQYTLSPRLVLGAFLGGGLVLVHDLSYRAGQDPVSTWIPSLDGGGSLRWLFNPRGFAELGLGYVNLLSADGPQGFLLPFIGAGWKL